MAEVVTQTSEPVTEGGLFKPPGGPVQVEVGAGDSGSRLVLRVYLPVTGGVAHAAPVESETLAIELAQRKFGKARSAVWQVLAFDLVLPVGVLAPGGEA